MAGGHRHREHSGAALVAAAERALNAAGERWTDMRAAVFGELARHDRPASAYDIAEALSASLGRRVAANTVYRILDLFVGANLALRVESANAYLANSHPGCVHDCIFLVCDECGGATHVDSEDASRTVRGVAEGEGFRPVRPVLEVRGVCGACR